MIPVGRPQHLGNKTLAMQIIKSVLPTVFLLILVVILSIFKDYFIQYSTQNISLIGEVAPAFGANLVSSLPLFIPALFFLAIILGSLGIIVSVLQYKFFTFTLEEFGLKLKRGVLRVEEISIPYRQMQDVDVTRPLIYRFFGLSRLVVFSAGHEQPDEPEQTDTLFDPIDHDIAEDIRVILGRRIGVQVIEHESEADREELTAKSQPVPDL